MFLQHRKRYFDMLSMSEYLDSLTCNLVTIQQWAPSFQANTFSASVGIIALGLRSMLKGLWRTLSWYIFVFFYFKLAIQLSARSSWNIFLSGWGSNAQPSCIVTREAHLSTVLLNSFCGESYAQLEKNDFMLTKWWGRDAWKNRLVRYWKSIRLLFFDLDSPVMNFSAYSQVHVNTVIKEIDWKLAEKDV
jgi:hypothetical protein